MEQVERESIDVSVLMHRNGINLRYIGLVIKELKSQMGEDGLNRSEWGFFEERKRKTLEESCRKKKKKKIDYLLTNLQKPQSQH